MTDTVASQNFSLSSLDILYIILEISGLVFMVFDIRNSMLSVEECRLLGYKTPVRTPQEVHYVSATESSWLMLCKIRGFHSGDYE
jgi:hypothetical protein